MELLFRCICWPGAGVRSPTGMDGLCPAYLSSQSQPVATLGSSLIIEISQGHRNAAKQGWRESRTEALGNEARHSKVAQSERPKPGIALST